MAQLKEQNKTAEKQLNKTEIANLWDAVQNTGGQDAENSLSVAKT